MFESLFDFIQQITQQNIGSLVGIFTATITPLLGACVVLYAIYLAYQALYDAENMMIMESMKFIGSLALCTTVALSTEWYIDSIVPIIYYSGDDIANALLGNTGSGALQTMFEKMLEQFNATWGEVSFGLDDSWGKALFFVLLSALILLGYTPFILIATAYLLIAKVMVSFLLVLGPLFIMFAFFPSTRSMFQSWTGQCLNYVLLTIVYPLAFNIFTETIDFILFNGERVIGLSTALMTLILFGCCILISVQIPVFTSSLSGGVGINGLVSNIGRGLSGARKAAKGTYNAGKTVKQGGDKLSRAIADRLKNNVKPG
ncbi:type IV secretion system protein [Vibrio parahaemolyticus]|nr:type IV secretion system protein [Vibrio parahaemolyticus]